jgi:spermidine/putrescine transport system ATP-binding protein
LSVAEEKSEHEHASAAAPADVRLERVTKRFDDVVAVDDLSIQIPQGSFFALLGPSGCGKTTTLRMIGGFEEPDAGTIYLDDRPVTGLPPYKRDVNTVFQSYALFPHLSIFENVAFGLRRKGVKSSEIKSRVHDMLALVELPGYEQRKPTQISGGQAQRVALARALINRPSVLLLDEPLGALDLKLRKQMQVELKRIQQEVGITFVYVTHDQEEAMTMSDRIAVMNRGRYEQLGDPELLYERPSTRFVAGFLGISNLLPATVIGRDGSYASVRLASDQAIRVPGALVDGQARVSIGIRPEKIRLHDTTAPAPSGHNRLTGTVRDASYLGVSTQYQIESEGGTLTVYEQNVERASRSELWSRGDAVQLTWSPDHSFVVPADSAADSRAPTSETIGADAPPATARP